MEELACVDPQTGEIIELDDAGLEYLDELIKYYLDVTNDNVETLKRIMMNLAAFNLAKQEKDMLVEYVKIQLAMM